MATNWTHAHLTNSGVAFDNARVVALRKLVRRVARIIPNGTRAIFVLSSSLGGFPTHLLVTSRMRRRWTSLLGTRAWR